MDDFDFLENLEDEDDEFILSEDLPLDDEFIRTHFNTCDDNVIENFPFIEDDVDAITDYELFSRGFGYLDEKKADKEELKDYAKKSEIPDVSEFVTKDTNELENYPLSSSLSDVAFSGDYDDLTNKPTIPTKTSDLDNDSGFITKSVNDLTNYTKSSDLSTVATSGDYDDLIDKPTIPDVSNFITKDVNDLTYYTKSSELSTVATSGSYNDLSNKPTIPIINEYAVLNGKRKDITNNTAWNEYSIQFDNNDEFSTSNSDLFEQTTTGIKCKFNGSVLIIRAFTLNVGLDDKEFDIKDDYRTYYLLRGVNKNNFNIKTVSTNDIITINYVGDATSFTIYNSRIVVVRLK